MVEIVWWHSWLSLLGHAAIPPGNRRSLHFRTRPATDAYGLGARWFSFGRLLPVCAPDIQEHRPHQNGDEGQANLVCVGVPVVWLLAWFHPHPCPALACPGDRRRPHQFLLKQGS